jgi:molecular chaperone DnaJ
VVGNISLRVPPGTQSGQVFHLRGRGLPRVNASGSGDLHVRVQLWTPQSFTPEQEALLVQLQSTEGAPPARRSKGFWSRMKEALGA